MVLIDSRHDQDVSCLIVDHWSSTTIPESPARAIGSVIENGLLLERCFVVGEHPSMIAVIKAYRVRIHIGKLGLLRSTLGVEAPGRVELPTNGLGNRCSIHLSYGAISSYPLHSKGLLNSLAVRCGLNLRAICEH